MGFFDNLDDFAAHANHKMSRGEVDSDLLEFADNAYLLFKAGRITSEKMAKLAKGDVDLLKSFLGCPLRYLPGTVDEVKEMRIIAQSALIILIEENL